MKFTSTQTRSQTTYIYISVHPSTTTATTSSSTSTNFGCQSPHTPLPRVMKPQSESTAQALHAHITNFSNQDTCALARKLVHQQELLIVSSSCLVKKMMVMTLTTHVWTPDLRGFVMTMTLPQMMHCLQH